MQVLLVATDEDPKLRPLTDTTATPLVPVVNRPVMAVAVEILARAGYKELLVSLCNRGGSIASYFGSGSRWGVHIEYVIQRQAWGSAGALRWASRLLTETVLVLPADSIIDLDIDAALVYHRAHQSKVTMILHQPPNESVPNPVVVDTNGRVLGASSEMANGQVLCHTGAFIFEPDVLQSIPAYTEYDSYSQLIPTLLDANIEIYGYQMQGYWNPLDSFQAYQDAQRVFLHSAYTIANNSTRDQEAILPIVRYPSIEGQQIAPGIWIGPNHAIHPSARLAPPICIGEGCRIGYGTELGPEIVIGSNVIIDDEATLQHSIVLGQTYIGQLVNINNRVIDKTVLIDVTTSESTQIVDPFLLAEATPVMPSQYLRRSLAILAAFILMIGTLPLTIPIALVVFCTSGGKLFVRSPRLGRFGFVTNDRSAAPQTFDLLAFRTRRADGGWTAVGRWLNRWEWDRFPELWNVVKGDLELVGVKPLPVEEATLLHEAWHQKRYEHPPGFTGLWYIQTGPEGSLDEILVADAYYVATHTWRDDLLLLLRTPMAWLRRRRPQQAQHLGDNDYPGQMDNVGSS